LQTLCGLVGRCLLPAGCGAACASERASFRACTYARARACAHSVLTAPAFSLRLAAPPPAPHRLRRYQHDIEEARRAAEALASQCAAQSSLIATLKREVEAANENLTAQKLVVQRVEQKGAADIEVAQRDIEALHERIVELQLAGDAKEAGVVKLNVALGELKARLADSGAERGAAEAARQRALDGYVRMFLASRHLVRGWRRAKLQAETQRALVVAAREQVEAAQARADRAEGEAADAKVTAVAAAQLREKALQRARELQSELDAAVGACEGLRTDADAREAALAECDGAVEDLQRRLDSALSAAAKAVHHKEAAVKRGTELQGALQDKTFEADSLRETAVGAQHKEREASAKARHLEEQMAQSHARVKALEHTEQAQEARIAALTADVESLGQQLAAAEREIVPLREELSRRPPIDILRTLDVQNLMQRNSQAAQAMQGLLEWQQRANAAGQ
jgi:chromosome segregation ATPase